MKSQQEKIKYPSLNPEEKSFFQDLLLADAAKLLNEKDAIIDEKDIIIDDKNSVIEKKSEVIDELKKRVNLLQEIVNLAKANRFGNSTEKYAGQAELFDEAELYANEEAGPADEESPEDPSPTKPKKAGRKGLSKALPRVQVFHRLSDEEKAGAIDTFFTKTKEELDIVPAKAQVIEHMQEKAVFADDNKRVIKAATLPKHPLGKSIASIDLLAHIIISKYADGLPLYRLENILKRYGGDITRTSMANWVIKLRRQLQPLINLLREHQNSYDYINMDETRIQVLKELDHSPSSHKWMWVTRGGPPDKPIVLFHYQASRKKSVPIDLLDGFRGFLQADGYAGYEAVCAENLLILLGCWDHVRRKFVEAEKAAGKTKQGKGSSKTPKYAIALSKIRKLYLIEARIKEKPAHEKYLERQRLSIPVLEDLKAWLDNNITKMSTGGKTHIAMQYALNQWSKLIRYCEDGRLNISNVLAENAIRPFVIGRKNWLFADTPQGAHASATHYSLIETAKACGVEPFVYYRWMLARLPYADTVDDYEALLPWNFKNSE